MDQVKTEVEEQRRRRSREVEGNNIREMKKLLRAKIRAKRKTLTGRHGI